MGVERVMRRAVVRQVLTLALAAAYLLFEFFLFSAFPRWPLALAALAAGLAFTPLRCRLHRLSDRVLYGGWYDHRSVGEEMSQALAGIVDAEEMGSLLVDRLSEVMRLTGAQLLLPAEEGELVPVHACGRLISTAPRVLPRGSAIAGELLNSSRPLGRADLLARLTEASLAQDEREWLTDARFELFVPLVRRGAFGSYILGKLQGVLLLGQKAGQERFDVEDRRMLGNFAWEAAVAAENIELFSALRRRADEVNQLYSRLVASREDERKRLARELHDRVIQDLIDLLFLLDATGAPALKNEAQSLRHRLRGVIDSLRHLCSELRPSALDDLSLALAVKGYVAEMREKSGLPILLRLPTDGDDSLEALAEDARLSLFRVLQEALANVHRHAQATEVYVEIGMGPGRVTLEVRDDGRGFAFPANLSSLIRQGHFGLAGAAERMSLLGGTFEIESSPSRGTTLRAGVPLTLS